MPRTYFIDKIDDESSEQFSETIEAIDDQDAKRQALEILRERGWDAAEIWDKDADVFIKEVRV